MGRGLHCQVSADVAFSEASNTLLEDLPRVVQQATEQARDHLERCREAGALPDGTPFPDDVEIGDDVGIDISEARATWNQAISADARWSADDRGSAFAAIGGAFEFSFASQDPPRTSLMFVGSLRPAPDASDDEVEQLAPVARSAVDLVLEKLAATLAEEHAASS